MVGISVALALTRDDRYLLEVELWAAAILQKFEYVGALN